MNWLKNFFKKHEEVTQEINLPNLPINNETLNFADIMAEQIKTELEAVKQANNDMKEFESITHDILKDITPLLNHEVNGFYFPYINPKIRVANIGKVIDKHVKRGLFNKKVKDLITDGKDS